MILKQKQLLMTHLGLKSVLVRRENVGNDSVCNVVVFLWVMANFAVVVMTMFLKKLVHMI